MMGGSEGDVEDGDVDVDVDVDGMGVDDVEPMMFVVTNKTLTTHTKKNHVSETLSYSTYHNIYNWSNLLTWIPIKIFIILLLIFAKLLLIYYVYIYVYVFCFPFGSLYMFLLLLFICFFAWRTCFHKICHHKREKTKNKKNNTWTIAFLVCLFVFWFDEHQRKKKAFIVCSCWNFKSNMHTKEKPSHTHQFTHHCKYASCALKLHYCLSYSNFAKMFFVLGNNRPMRFVRSHKSTKKQKKI